MTRTLTTIPIALILITLSPALARQLHATHATSPIGYVSMQRVLNESIEAKGDAARLQAMQQQKTAELRAKQHALDVTREKLAQAGGILKGSIRSRLQQQELQQRTDLERSTALAQTDFVTLQRQVQTDFRNRLKSIVDEVATRRGFDIVLNEDSAVVWSATSADLTTAVVERLNARAESHRAK